MAKERKQRDLPGMEDRAIHIIDELAERYDELRKELSAVKEQIMDAMKKQKKVKYVHAAIEVNIVEQKDGLRVKVKKEDAEESAGEAGAE
jgi:hypothetical protein